MAENQDVFMVRNGPLTNYRDIALSPIAPFSFLFPVGLFLQYALRPHVHCALFNIIRSPV